MEKKQNANELSVFNFEGKDMRVVEIDGAPWWIGNEVATILGYSNPRDALRIHVDEDDKNSVVIRDGIPGNPNKAVINESGLYALIIGSKLPTAKKFKHWVTSEVLPSLRKHGTYIVGQENLELSNEELIAKALVAANSVLEERAKRIAALEHERNMLEAKANQQQEEITMMKPKAEYYDQILKSTNTMNITQIAKDYGLSAQRLNAILHDMKIQYKSGTQWVLYQKYAQLGYTRSETHIGDSGFHSWVNVQTKWTQKGRIFLYETLKANGILPLIEQ